MKLCPKISIIILNFDGKDVLKSCLFSVLGINYPNVEVVVVDNNSKDNSFEEAKGLFLRMVFLKNEKNLGYSAGNNIGIKYALENKSDYVLLLNNDTKVNSDLLQKMVECLEKNKKIGMASPVVFRGDSQNIWFSGGEISWFLMKTFHKIKKNKNLISDAGFISGCCMLVRREVFEKIGFLDEKFFLYWEDADFSVRVKKAGFRCVVLSSCFIRHYEKSEERKVFKTYWLVLSGLIFFKKNARGLTKIWINLFIYFRKLKNRIDIYRKKDTETAIAVQKAYNDFLNLK